MSSNKICVFISNLSSNSETRKQQQRILDILGGAKIPFDICDVSEPNTDHLVKMRHIVGDQKALAPQICSGGQHCGDYNAFEEAVEDKNLKGFLKLE